MKKRILALFMAALMVVSLAACSSSSSSDTSSDDTAAESTDATEDADTSADTTDTTADTSDASYSISVILKTLSSEYWSYVKAGCDAYAAENPSMTIDVKGPTSETAYDEQQNMIETDLSSGTYDAYIISPLQQDTVATLISGVTDPVIAVDTNIEADEVISFVGTGNYAAAYAGGVAAYEAAVEAGWEEINCIEIAGVQGDSTNTDRMSGYMDGVNDSGGTFLEDEVQYADGVADKAVTCMEAIIQNHPEGVAIIVCNNDDMAIAAAQTAADYEAYANTIFVGFDGNITACEAILEGSLTMSVAQEAYNMGYMACEAAVAVLSGETIEETIDSGNDIVDADNAQERLDTLNSYLE